MSDNIDDIVELASAGASAVVPATDILDTGVTANEVTNKKCNFENEESYCENGTLFNKKTFKPLVVNNPAGGLANLICPLCKGKDYVQPMVTQQSCDRCRSLTNQLQKCPTCGRRCCQNCVSFIDKSFCKDCLDEGKVEIKVEDGLTDVEGEHHKGRLLVPIGDAVKSPCRIIADMNEEQLEEHLKRCCNEVRRYEQGADYWRIQKAATELEKAHKEHQRLKALRGVVVPGIGRIMSTAPSAKKANGAASNDPYAMLAAKLQAAGITQETLKAAIEKAKKTK